MEIYIPDELHSARRSRMSTGSSFRGGYTRIPKGLFVDYGVYLYEVLKDREHQERFGDSGVKVEWHCTRHAAACLSPLEHNSLFILHALYISTSPTLISSFTPKNPHLYRHHPGTPFTSAFRSHLLAFQSSRVALRIPHSPLITSAVTYNLKTHISHTISALLHCHSINND